MDVLIGSKGACLRESQYIRPNRARNFGLLGRMGTSNVSGRLPHALIDFPGIL